ncbi:MAG: NAD(P)-dependent oxidoreductase [Bacteroidales bacterium]|nr:NAD(P)-dependent oxidoreductase [Bacteroidales bacterium]MBS3775441.1 NAD(P)-dependent oxidoreductase [Bacteroidales bacterium]
MNRIILTGGSGFIGNHLLNVLLNNHEDIYVVEHKKKIDDVKRCQVIRGGIKALNAEMINDIRPDIVFHCARPVVPGLRRTGRKIAAYKAEKFNSKLITGLKNSNVQPNLVFASGSLMYGNSKEAHSENSPVNPISFARQYSKGEKPLVSACLRNAYPVHILRFPWILGDGSWFKWFYMDIMKKYRVIPSFGDMKNKMQFIDVHDAADLMRIYAIKAPAPGIYNVFSDQILRQEDFVNRLSQIFQLPVKNHEEIFTRQMEKEALEAFTSNIILKTNYPNILNKYKVKSLDNFLCSFYETHKNWFIR